LSIRQRASFCVVVIIVVIIVIIVIIIFIVIIVIIIFIFSHIQSGRSGHSPHFFPPISLNFSAISTMSAYPYYTASTPVPVAQHSHANRRRGVGLPKVLHAAAQKPHQHSQQPLRSLPSRAVVRDPAPELPHLSRYMDWLEQCLSMDDDDIFIPNLLDPTDVSCAA
jgi:hypothetical protein